MKKLILVLIILLISCKSTQHIKKNQLDINSFKIEEVENNISISDFNLQQNEIEIIVANPKLPIVITDKKGNKQKFTNAKKLKITKKKEAKKDSVVTTKAVKKETLIDKSKINEEYTSVSDANNYKWIFIASSFSLLFLLIAYLVWKFKR